MDLKYFDKVFIEEFIYVNQKVPRSRVQSNYFGFSFTGNSVRNELDFMAYTKENQIQKDVKEEEDKNMKNEIIYLNIID